MPVRGVTVPSAVEEAVRARVDAARARRARRDADRAARAVRRRYGLAARHRAKDARLAVEEVPRAQADADQ